MKLNYQLTYNDYLEFNLFHMDNSDEIKKSLLVSRVILSIIIFGVAFLAVRDRNISGYVFFAVIWLVCMIFYTKYFRAFVKRRIEKLIKEGKNIGFLGNCSLILSDEGINVISDSGEVKTRWEGIERISVDKEHIFIYFGSLAAHIVPIRVFADNSEKEFFLEALNNKINL